VPPQWWGNSVEPKRALAVFEYPNAFALWLTPLLAFGLPFLFDREFKPGWFKFLYLLGFGGLLFNLSRGGWAGFAAAVVVFALSYQNKKVLKYLVALLIPLAIVIYILPNLRYRLILPFKGDKSTLSRFSLWHTAESMLKTSPILGKGLYGFRTLYDKFNTDQLTPAYDYPHNVVLNFWVETGLLGLITFLLICAWAFIGGLRNKGSPDRGPYQLGLALFIVALLVHGLIDVPYFLNVLALEFWMILALAK
jgi:O-antigen ligase